MLPRGRSRNIAALLSLVGALVVYGALTYSLRPSSAGQTNATTSTLTISTPTPFVGCSAFSPVLSTSTQAVLDLIRPSAFLTSPTGNLFGEGGAISTAELVSTSPEEVTYTIDTHLSWSNGAPFGVANVRHWWLQARRVSGYFGSGYRDISSMEASASGDSITATFSSSFPEWNQLFRDIDLSAPRSCTTRTLLDAPSLGPYKLRSISKSRAVLVSNPDWTADFNRFKKLIITTSPPSALRARNTVAYQDTASQETLTPLIDSSRLSTGSTPSSKIVELEFSSTSVNVDERAALSWLISRRNISLALNSALGAATSEASSALFSPGNPNAPGAYSLSIPSALAPSLADPLLDSASAGRSLLSDNGWQRSKAGWIRNHERLSVRLLVGPTLVERLVGNGVLQAWHNAGVHVERVDVASDGAALAALPGHPNSVAVVIRDVGEGPLSAVEELDDLGAVSRASSATPSLGQIEAAAQALFDPVAANGEWQKIDQEILSGYLIRPMVSTSAVTSWTTTVANVTPASSLAGLIDQATNLGIEQSSAVHGASPSG